MLSDKDHTDQHDQGQRGAAGQPSARHRNKWLEAVRKAARQMIMMLPVLVGVILLVGLFQAVVSSNWISSVFVGYPPFDAFFGAVFGSVLAGNPVNSYVVAKGLLDISVGFAGVIALILTWVTVGLVQLPAEMAALGLRFGISRAVLAFLLSIPMACLTAWLVRILS